jgi:hypothetical protein
MKFFEQVNHEQISFLEKFYFLKLEINNYKPTFKPDITIVGLVFLSNFVTNQITQGRESVHLHATNNCY